MSYSRSILSEYHISPVGPKPVCISSKIKQILFVLHNALSSLSFVIGSFLVNLLSILIIILFIFSFFKERNYKILNQKYLYLLCLCYLAILLSFLNSEYKSFTFLKTILLLKIIILPVSFQYFFTKNPKKSILVYSSPFNLI